MHGKFSRCFSSSLLKQSSYGNLHFLTLLIGCSTKHLLWKLMNLFHIFECLSLELRGNTPFLWIWNIFLPICFSHETYELSLFLDLYILIARNCKCLWWVFSLLSKAKRSSYVAVYLLYTTCKISYLLYPFSSLHMSFSSRTLLHKKKLCYLLYWESFQNDEKCF